MWLLCEQYKVCSAYTALFILVEIHIRCGRGVFPLMITHKDTQKFTPFQISHTQYSFKMNRMLLLSIIEPDDFIALYTDNYHA